MSARDQCPTCSAPVELCVEVNGGEFEPISSVYRPAGVLLVQAEIQRGREAAAELAALKARRCDGCAWYVPDPAFMSPESAFGTCAMPHSGPTPEPPVSLYMDGEPIRVDVLVDADHACNAWEARTDG